MAETIEALKEMLEAERKARLNAENKYQQSLDFISNIKSNLPGLVYIFDTVRNQNTYWNQQLSNMLGYSPAETVTPGHHFPFSILHPDDRTLVNEHRQRLIEAPETAIWEIEYRVQPKKDSWLWLKSRETVLSRHEDGTVQEIIGFAINNGENKNLASKSSETEILMEEILRFDRPLAFISNKSGQIIAANQALGNYLRTDPALLVGTDYLEAFYSNPALIAQHRAADQHLVQQLEYIQLEEKHCRPNEPEHCFLCIRRPLLLNKEVHIFGLFIDVTHQKLNKPEVTESEELYRLISENSTDLISVHSPDGTINYYSASCKDLLGYEASELMGTNPYHLIHPDDVLQTQRANEIGLLQKETKVLTQYRIRKKSGEYIWFESSTKLILDESGQLIRLQSSSRDITERKKTEVALEKSERKYRDLVSYSQAIIFTHTLDGTILSTNPIMQKILGYSELEMIGLPFAEIVRPRDRSRYQDYLRNINQNNKVVDVITVLDKQGRQKHLLYHNIKVDDPEVEPYVIAFAQDITERLEAENELKRAKNKAEESAKSKEIFLANMSHEIRTPMNGILGMAALLQKTNLTTAQQNYLKLIQESAQNLLIIINDVLDVAKIESGKLQLEKITFNLNEILYSAQQSLIYKAEEKDIFLHVKPVKLDNPLVTGDPYRLTQILINLLSNAIKFTEVGQVELAAEVTNESIFDYTFRISVSDTGIGIAPDKLEKIFESFVQANSDTTRIYGGTGLGLTICKNLVELQGGHIWAKSKPGRGVTFTFEITYPKVHLIPTPSVVSPERIDYTSLRSFKILLAEDNAINQFMAESILTGWGVQVDIASNGQEAIKLHLQFNYDAILMDIQMPGMGGVEATRIIRQMADPVKARIPIIALTANALKGDSDIYLEAGMNDYMSKPYEEEKLFYKIYQNVRRNNPVMKSHTNPDEINAVSSPAKQLYSLALVQQLAKGDQSFINQMIDIFVSMIPEALRNMQAHAAAGEWQQLSQVAHSIKPAVDTLLINSIRESLLQIEKDGKNAHNVTALPVLVANISRTLASVIADLQVEFRTNP